MTHDNDWMLIAEAARTLGVAAPTVRLWHRLGKLQAIRTTSGYRLFRRADVMALLAARSQS